MNNININKILQRDSLANKIKNTLIDFEKNKNDLTKKRGIYIYGGPGSGKSKFILSILEELNYDIIKFDAGDIRNKSIIDNITHHTMASKNVVSLFNKKPKPIAIIMDEIDGMNNGDKGGINSLIKLVRPKKTKKQKTEEMSMNPIICIGNYHIDKKIKELMKVCMAFEIKSPNSTQMKYLIEEMMPKLEDHIKISINTFIQGDLRKLNSIYDIYFNQNSILKNEIIKNVLKPKFYNEDTKEITKNLINNNFDISSHITVMNETDRTIVGLLWHENIIDVLNKFPLQKTLPFYQKILSNICFADYIDRITFQKQIWLFNELSSLIKTFQNNRIFHKTFEITKINYNPVDIRFTKVLTKYSTEYNNSIFIQNICQLLGLDKKDTFLAFQELKSQYSEEQIYNLLETYDICKLDVNRMFRYMNRSKENDIIIN